MKKLGTLLQEAGIIDEIQLVRALSHHRKWKCRLGQSLVELGFVSEENIARTIAGQLGLPYVDLDPSATPRELLEFLPEKLAEEKIFFPVGYSHSGANKAAIVAFSDPTDSALAKALADQLGMRIEPVVARDGAIESAVRNWGKYRSRNAPSSPEEQLSRAHRDFVPETGAGERDIDEAEVVEVGGSAEKRKVLGRLRMPATAPPAGEPAETPAPEQELLSVADLPPLDGEDPAGEEMEVEHTAAWEQVMPDVTEQSLPSNPEESVLPVIEPYEQIDGSAESCSPPTNEPAPTGAPEDRLPPPAETFAVPVSRADDGVAENDAAKRPEKGGVEDNVFSGSSPAAPREYEPAPAVLEKSPVVSTASEGNTGRNSASNERILMEIKSLREEITQLTILVESLVTKGEKK